MEKARRQEIIALSMGRYCQCNNGDQSESPDIMSEAVSENLINFTQDNLGQDKTHRVANIQPANAK